MLDENDEHEESVFTDELMVKAQKDLQKILGEIGSSMKLGFIQVQTPVGNFPVPEPNMLTQAFGSQQQVIYDLYRKSVMTEALVVVLISQLDEYKIGEVAKFASDLITSATDVLRDKFEKAKEEANKPKIAMPGGHGPLDGNSRS